MTRRVNGVYLPFSAYDAHFCEVQHVFLYFCQSSCLRHQLAFRQTSLVSFDLKLKLTYYDAAYVILVIIGAEDVEVLDLVLFDDLRIPSSTFNYTKEALFLLAF